MSDYDHYIEYETRPDPFDKRRLNRAEYAVASIPALLFSCLLSVLQIGLMQFFAKNNAWLRAQVAIGLLAYVSYVLFKHQSTQLTRRCQDAEKIPYAAIGLHRCAVVLACCNGIFPLLGKPLLLVVLCQFIYGIMLPLNDKNNIHGAARLPNRFAEKWQYTAHVLACFAVFLLWTS